MSEHDSATSRLIHDAQQSVPAALDRLLEGYCHYLMLLARTGLGTALQGKADPSDVVQETLLKAYQGFAQFRGQTEAELAAWLRQILARTVADLVRRHKGTGSRQLQRERSLEELLDQSSAALGKIVAARGSSPSQAAQGRECAVVLADALTKLPADYREVLVLRSIEEREWDQVAERMGRSTGAVRLLWTRALKQLRPLIEGLL